MVPVTTAEEARNARGFHGGVIYPCRLGMGAGLRLESWGMQPTGEREE